MGIELQTVEGVELVSTGTYQLASGETTFTQEDLEAAVQASKDPTVTSPRLKLGHDDPRFADAIASGELSGEPAFGVVGNLRMSDDRQTVIGDYENVPGWLAETLPSSYPGRSIEGGFSFTAASGRTYSFVISDVALLGVTWPGVGSLEDLKAALDANGPIATPVAASGAYAFAGGSSTSFVTARVARPNEDAPPQVVAGMDMGMVGRAFCEDLDEGSIDTSGLEDVGPTLWWWPRSVRAEDGGQLVIIADDDAGHLIRVPFTVKETSLTYGSPEVVMETFVPVDAQLAKKKVGRVLASWPTSQKPGSVSSIRAARPTNQEAMMDIDPAVLRARLGLPDDADEAAITAALATEQEHKPAGDAGAAIPDGMVLVDEETFAQVREGAEAGLAVAAQLNTNARDKSIKAAIDEGRIPPSRREHFEKLWGADEASAKTLLTASVADGGLAPGLIPAANREIGTSGDGEGSVTAAEADHDAYMRQFFPKARAKLMAKASGRERVGSEA